MRTVASGIRNAALGYAWQPEVVVSVQRRRPQFSVQQARATDANLPAHPIGEDYYAETYFAPVADAIGLSGGNLLRVVSFAPYSVNGNWYYSNIASDNDLDSYTVFAAGQKSKTAHGVIANGADARVFYIRSSDGNLCYRDGPAFGAEQVVGTPHTFTTCAVAPVSTTTVFMVGYHGGQLWLDKWWYSGGWQHLGTAWVIQCHDDLGEECGLWLDAEHITGNEYALLLSISNKGRAACVRYDGNCFSPPHDVIPSGVEYLTRHTRPSSLSLINGYLWAVLEMAVDISDGGQAARATVLARSQDGRHWMDYSFVSTRTCFGKLLTKGDYLYVLGGCVALKATTTRDFTDSPPSGMEWDISDYVYSLSYDAPEDGVPELTVQGKRDSTWGFGVGDRIAASVRVGSDTIEFASGLLDIPREYRESAKDDLDIVARGVMAQLMAYAAPADILFVNAYSMVDDMTEVGLKVACMSGMWKKVYNHSRQMEYLRVEKTGVAVYPHTVSDDAMIQVRFARRQKGNLSVVFWYEDEDNYWEARLYNWSSQTMTLRIRQKLAGVWYNRSPSTDVTVVNGSFYYLTVVLRGPKATAYFGNDGNLTNHSSVQYTTDNAVPRSYQLGIAGEGASSETDVLVEFAEGKVVELGRVWTVEEFLEAVIKRANVVPAFRDQAIVSSATLGSPSSLGLQCMGKARDVDVSFDVTNFNSGKAGVYFWAGNTSTTNTSGFVILLDASDAYLHYLTPGASTHSLSAAIASMPLTVTLNLNTRVRVLVQGQVARVYINDVCAAAFVLPIERSGQFGLACKGASVADVRAPEMGSRVLDSVWDVGMPAMEVIQRNLQGHHVFLVERADAVLCSWFHSRDDLGTYNGWRMLRKQEGLANPSAPTLLRVMGGYDWVDFWIPELAVQRGTLFARIDNPVLETSEALVQEAVRHRDVLLGELGQTEFDAFFDPAMEVHDQFTHDGVNYEITRYALSWSRGGVDSGPVANAMVSGRKLPSGKTTLVWGSGKWGEGVWG